MGVLKKAILVLMLPLLAFTSAHKYYVSVTHVNYSAKDDALQMTTRVFIDDLEAVILARYGQTVVLDPNTEPAKANGLLQKYLKSKFAVSLNGTAVTYDYIGKKYDGDVLVFYMEVPKIKLPNLTSIEIQNELLTDVFEEQQNIVHFKVNDHKKSMVLVKEDAKGMLML